MSIDIENIVGSNITGRVQQLNESLGALQGIASLLGKVAAFFGNIINWANIGIGFMQSIGMSSMQAYSVIAILGLLTLFGIFKFLLTITKIVIFLLILWVIASIIGIV